MTAINNCYKFGRFYFCLSSKDQELLTFVHGVLPSIGDFTKDAKDAEIAEINLDVEIEAVNGAKFQASKENISLLLDYLITRGFHYHSGLLWLDAACLIDNYQQVLIIAGASNTGKSTLALSLAKTMNWKIVSEDVTFIDSATSTIVPFARPLSLRADTKDKFFAASGEKLDSLVANEWYFDKNDYCHQAMTAKFTYAILLEPFSVNKSTVLEKNEIINYAYLTRLLSLSNALRLPAAIKSLNDCFTESRCFTFKDGQLSQRLETMKEIAKQAHSRQTKTPAPTEN